MVIELKKKKKPKGIIKDEGGREGCAKVSLVSGSLSLALTHRPVASQLSS